MHTMQPRKQAITAACSGELWKGKARALRLQIWTRDLRREKEMEKIASFTIDHTRLLPGLYVSRRDAHGDVCVTTFDLRVTAPNREPVMDVPAIHTIEHLGATYLRNSAVKDDVVYFGPMGCRTGFYLVMFGKLESAEVLDTVLSMCDFILAFEGEIPGARPEECGNYLDQNLPMAKYYTEKYRRALVEHRRLTYPA